MPIEIERKFLVVGASWRRSAGPGQRFCQGYLARTPRGSVRVRRAAGAATVTVKGRRSGICRPEYEYPIPVEDAEDMLRELCAKPLVEKVRHEVRHAGMIWEVDVYCGAAEGLVLAEVELDHSEEAIVLPSWVGEEVTEDLRYRNSEILTGAWRTDPRRAGVRPAGGGAGSLFAP